jgi:hypothetical protein
VLTREERLLIGQENPGGEQRAQSTKQRAEGTDQMLFILAPGFCLSNPRRRKRGMKGD